MAVGAYFHPNGLTLAQYNKVGERLDAIGQGSPEHRLHHSCFGEDGALMVFEIWDSPEAFEAYGPTLGPILAEVGVDVAPPALVPIHGLTQSAVDE